MTVITRQTAALTRKTLLIAGLRHLPSTSFRAFLLPVIFVAFLTFARYLFVPDSKHGVGTPAPIMNLADSMDGTRKLVFISNGLGNRVDDVIDRVASPVRDSGKPVVILQNSEDLAIECRQSLRGSSDCHAAVVFYNAPSGDDDNSGWNYTLRGDSAFGTNLFVDRHDNDVQKYMMPVQHAVDWAIADVDEDSPVPEEMVFTKTNEEERKNNIRYFFEEAIIKALGIAFYLGSVGIVYQLTGFMAMEREQGLSSLLEAMGAKKFSRFLSYHVAFDLLWLPGWIVMAIIFRQGIFIETNMGIMIIFYILTGLASASTAILGAAFFKKAQLSGITVTLVILVIGIASQISSKSSEALVVVLAFLNPASAYVYFLQIICRFERKALGTSLTERAPEVEGHGHGIPGIVFWVALIFQTLVYPLLAMFVEKWLYGTSSKNRIEGTENPENAVEIVNYTKEFRPGFIGKHTGAEVVRAVNDLTLNVRKGTIFGLLGANGSGKTTTLESIAGTGKMGQYGQIRIATSKAGGIGICPQKNVLWDFLTVEEHVQIWNKIKCEGEDPAALRQLIADCDLDRKIGSQSRTLSGGQKRKLQLAVMLTGGSEVCCIDEVSSGVDPLSRRKLWEIILDARGERTLLLTTHFLDEADILSDHIAILSKGSLKTEGSTLQLKSELGGGFRIYAPLDSPDIPNANTKRIPDGTVYRVPDSTAASVVIDKLEKQGITDYQVAGPTIEDVFLKVAEETADTVVKSTDQLAGDSAADTVADDAFALKHTRSYTNKNFNDGVQLQNGSRVGIGKQTLVFMKKRLTLAKRNWLPLLAAFLLPIIAGGCTMLFVKDYERPGCSRADLSDDFSLENFEFKPEVMLVAGPASKLLEFIDIGQLENVATRFVPDSIDVSFQYLLVDTEEEFQNAIATNYSKIYPGGIFIRDEPEAPIIAWRGNFFNDGMMSAILMQNLLNRFYYGANVTTAYQELNSAFRPGQGDTLQFVTYFGLIMAAFPAFFALYPCIERLRNIRALEYSNGARSAPLWLAYALFDFTITTVMSAIIAIIFNASSDQWFGLGYLFLVIVLYCATAILMSYILSLFSKSQLAAFAFTAGSNAVLFLLYFVAYMSVINSADAADTDDVLNKMHLGFAVIAPIASLVRAMFISLNSFSILCRGESVATNPAEFNLYGGPITYLIIQIFVLYGFLLWWESGRNRVAMRATKRKEEDIEEKRTVEKEIGEELERTKTIQDGLKVEHISKRFGKNQAVDDVTFGVGHSEVFALLGPNGAGKTTTINMIRGELYSDTGDIFVENIPISQNRNEARTHLGVCPQFDAIDRMTVLEHLRFYANVRGVSDVEYNVQQVIKAVGLENYGNRLAEKLSGGNKRKLSLGIALMGNPTVVLLDEPSSGMDAAAKRVMWRTLASVAPGRSLIITTHSMEEADALATKAGILAKRMLTLGTTDYLRKKHGDRYFIQLSARSAPNTSEEEMERLKAWILENFSGAELEKKSFNGSIRFSIPIREPHSDANTLTYSEDSVAPIEKKTGVSRLFSLLEDNREKLGLSYYSVQQTSLEDIFIEVVRAEGVQEEGYGEEKKKGFFKKLFGKK